jgi:ABC-2 type transport system permease protein
VKIARGTLLRGASLADVQREMWPLVGFFVVMMSLAILRFRKRLD